jgi:hypothetical protein
MENLEQVNLEKLMNHGQQLLENHRINGLTAILDKKQLS